MKLIKTIRDSDTGGGFPDCPVEQERRASRAVVFDTEGNVALLHATKKNFHKLPGGGIEQGEDIETALRREVSEEIGCAVKNIRELGMVEEFRNQWALHQISYCFLADLDGAKGLPHLEEDEIADGFETVWVGIDDAIKILESETSIEDYEGKFIQLRDLTLLKEAKEK
jgi:8-oxo-dGTP diphosphatase